MTALLAEPLADATFAQGKQSWEYERLYRIGPETVRVRIKRDAYIQQSSGVLDIYDPGARKWNELARIAPTLLAICIVVDRAERVSPYQSADRLDREAFVEDANALLAQAALVLGWERV